MHLSKSGTNFDGSSFRHRRYQSSKGQGSHSRSKSHPASSLLRAGTATTTSVLERIPEDQQPSCSYPRTAAQASTGDFAYFDEFCTSTVCKTPAKTISWEDSDASEEEGFDEDERDTEAYRQMMQVKKEMKKRVKQIGPGHPSHPDTQLSGRLGEHKGYKCSRCSVDPIKGVRYNCRDCPDFIKVDLCEDCYASSWMTFDMQYHVGKEHVFEGIQPFRKISQPVMIHKRLLKMNYPEPPRSPPPLKGPKVFY